MHHQDNLTRFNTDETLREFGDRKDTADLMKVEKIAVEQLNGYLRVGITFNQETPLCRHTIILAVL